MDAYLERYLVLGLRLGSGDPVRFRRLLAEQLAPADLAPPA
jgi:hypothetical protein